jgi:ubiquinol-cytochrome c reductase cytochrome c subunit
MTTSTKSSERRYRARSKLRRRFAGLLALGIALVGAGALYAVFAPEPQTAQAQGTPAQLRLGEQVYNNTCIACHGANLEGVQDRGPSLIGIGDAAVYFQTSSGRMPASRQEAQVERKPPKLTEAEIDAVGAYIQAHGGGGPPPPPDGAGRCSHHDRAREHDPQHPGPNHLGAVTWSWWRTWSAR